MSKKFEFEDVEKERKAVAISHTTGRELTPELEAEFKAIAASNEEGLVKPELVVRRAESSTSPLHKFFEWDDEKAADEYRLQQARYLIRSFQIEIEPLVVVPAFVSLGTDRTHGGGYRWGAEVLPHIDLKRNLMLTVLSDIEHLVRKVEDEPEIKPVRDAIVTVRTRLLE